jgi:hypothetical protein
MVSQREIDGLGPASSFDVMTRPGWRERAARRRQAAAAPTQAVVAEAAVPPEPTINAVRVHGSGASRSMHRSQSQQ